VSRLSSGKERRRARKPDSPAETRLNEFVGVTGRTPTDKNHAQLLIDGEETFEAIFSAIDTAEHEVLVQFYIIRSDAVGLALQERLIAAARRGVRVRVLCDVIGSMFLGFRYVRVLEQEDVQIKGIFGPHRALGRIGMNFRNHRKAVIIDGKIGFTGGLNIGQEYIDGGKAFDSWRDTHISFEGPMAAQLRDIFADDWMAVTGDQLPVGAKPEASGNMRGLVADSGPTDMLESGSLMLCAMVNMARKRLWIATPYLVPHADLSTALQLASLRGVDVRIMIPAPSDNILAWYASRNAAMVLAKAGIDVLEYEPGMMHSKIMLIDDDFASVGTVNLDIRSALLNFELTALIEDAQFAAQVDDMLRADFAKCAPLPDPAPRHVRFLAPVARLFGPLL
jgi:cardiolipin synthase